MLAVLQPGDLGAPGGNGNDIWGWTDPLTGSEWALMGLTSGTAFVDLSDPENPVFAGFLPTHSASSVWRDIKVFSNHAFIVADFAGNHGMQVFDLTELRNVTTPPRVFDPATELKAHYAGFDRAHNIVINEDSGYAYGVGSETCSGGLHMVNVQDPAQPVFAGCYSADGYTHDAQCVLYSGPDVEHQGKEICFAANEDTLTIVDTTDKANPLLLSRTGYPGAGYTHQGWLSEDHAYFIHDDEFDEFQFGHNTKTYTWDLTNLEAPALAGTFIAAGSSVDHNQYVRGGYTYQANYRRGLRILGIQDPGSGSLEEVAFFDTYPNADGNGFEGAWGVYPFFDSGIVVVSDVSRGLFVLRPRLSVIFDNGFEDGTTDVWSQTVPNP